MEWALSEDPTRRDIGLIKLEDIAATTTNSNLADAARSILKVIAERQSGGDR